MLNMCFCLLAVISIFHSYYSSMINCDCNAIKITIIYGKKKNLSTFLQLENVKSESPDQRQVQAEKHSTENVSSAVAPLKSTTLTSSPITSPSLNPAPVMGSNRLGASSGWSSSFSPEPTDSTGSKHQDENKSPPATDSKALKSPHRVKSFKSMLSDYSVQGPRSFGAPVYEESETESSSNEVRLQVVYVIWNLDFGWIF